MFNAFQSRCRTEAERRRSRDSSRLEKWSKKHQGRVLADAEQREELTKRYNNRVENFVLRVPSLEIQINEEPIQVRNLDELTVHYQKPLKQVSNRRDHQQMFCAYSRVDHQPKDQTSSVELRARRPKTVTHPIIKIDSEHRRANQSQYQAYNITRYDFRPRLRVKEIQHQPMRYNAVPRLLSEEIKQQKEMHKQWKLPRTKTGNTGESSSMRKSNSNDDEVMSILSKLIRPFIKKESTPKKNRSRNTSSVQFNADDEEEQAFDDPKQNRRPSTHQHSKEKLHFKAALHLATNKTPISKFAREGLQKCKIARFAALAEEKEKDHLLFFQDH